MRPTADKLNMISQLIGNFEEDDDEDYDMFAAKPKKKEEQ